MSPEVDPLVDVAAAISDGGAIDWNALEAAAGNQEERRHVARLRVVAELVRAHDSFREANPFDMTAGPGGWTPRLERIGAERPRGTPAYERSDRNGLWVGRVLGERYRVERHLGGGGMGEVWQAYDLKLCVEVALKAIRPEKVTPRQRDLLRREVRAARQIISPNVCRIFDLVEFEGRELISMEYVDGIDLAKRLRRQVPMALRQAREIASQLLAGLQAIHDAGVVHRDLKPANLMITPAGRLVVMDFGIAKQTTEIGGGTIAGTPAYMAPEQLRGGPVDARTDIYAAGLVLLDLVHPRRGRTIGDRLGGYEGPWRDALLLATADDPSDRPVSARELDRALEAATLRSGAKEERCPFPGLAAFTEVDATFFFGREAEVESLGKKLKRLHMVAVVGPSGVGKSSLLRAGLLPSLPEGWARLFCTPGANPFVSLGEALVPHLAGDPEALRSFLRFGEPEVAVSLFSRWRRDFEDAVLVVDQFEELFTQSPEDVQARFADLLGRLPLEADVRVVLSMRDDFLFRCHAHPGLKPILTELTLLPPLQGDDLRRALVHPALACGYRFEDDGLVEEIVGEVERERGALPLLAFTASRLWEYRDRERGLLPRKAYWAIGGVGGSLAQHAETTLQEIGEGRQPIVREMFRALITAQGARLSRDREELLSVAADGKIAAEILERLVEARLLTTFEAVDANDPAKRRQRVELVHESLLSHWPRLVRWQTQDADGAQFRDQLRQAAQLWDASGRPDDMLWSGTSYDEYRLWRDRYPGSLTSLEESFAAAAAERARRRQRRRRTLVLSSIATLAAGLAITATLWQRSERAQQLAVAETRRAEAEKLYTLSQSSQDLPSAYAYAIAALELSDQPAYRRYVLKVLLRAPAPFMLPALPNSHNAHAVDISRDGRWMAFGWTGGGAVELYSLEGGEPRVIGRHDNEVIATRFNEDASLLVSTALDGKARIWAIPEGKLLRTLDVSEATIPFVIGKDRLITYECRPGDTPVWRTWSLSGGESRLLGRAGETVTSVLDVTTPDVDPSGTWAVTVRDREVVVYALADLARGPIRILGKHPERLVGVRFGPNGDVVASFDQKGGVRLWAFSSTAGAPLRVLQGAARPLGVEFARTGSRLVAGGMGARLWDLESPGSMPEVLQDGWWKFQSAFDPRGNWLVTVGIQSRLEAWPLTMRRPLTLVGAADAEVRGIQFAPDGSWVAASSYSTGDIRLWPLHGGRVGDPETLFHEDDYGLYGLYRDDRGRTLLAPVADSVKANETLIHVSLPDRKVRVLENGAFQADVDADGRRIASWGRKEQNRGVVVRLWDARTGATSELGTTDDSVVGFVKDGRLLTDNAEGLYLWNVETREHVRIVGDLHGATPRLCGDRETILLHGTDGRLSFRRLDGTASRESPAVVTREDLVRVAADPTCKILAVGRKNGDVDVVRTDTGYVHHVPVHDGWVTAVAVDPGGRWIASAGGDGMKLWEIPSGESILDLPRSDFLARVRSFSNLRAVKDDRQPTGYAIQGNGIPDWRNPPRW